MPCHPGVQMVWDLEALGSLSSANGFSEESQQGKILCQQAIQRGSSQPRQLYRTRKTFSFFSSARFLDIFNCKTTR